MFLVFAFLAGALTGAALDARDETAIQRLVSAARQGDRAALERLYRLHVARVYRAVRPLCASDADAEDVVQETFVRAFAALERYRQRPGSRFASWLVTIAVNTKRRRARSGRRLDPVEPDALATLATPEAASVHDALGEALDRARLGRELLRALSELSERDRLSLTLRYGAELSASEVAEICEISEAHVRKICERQRRRLLERLRAFERTPTATSARSS